MIEARGDGSTVETTCLTRGGGLLRVVVDDRHGPMLAVTCYRENGNDEVIDAIVEVPMAAVRAALASAGYTVRWMDP